MKSVWTQSVKMREFDALSGDIKADVTVVGGGLAGILTAFFLSKSGVDVVLLEAKKIGGGITADTTAKITSQHGLCYFKMAKRFGYEFAEKYLYANEEAIGVYRKLCENIDCDFENQNSFVYSIANEENLKKELHVLSKLGFNAEFVKAPYLPFKVAGSVKFPHQAQFNPLKFINGISKNLRIYENSMVREIKGNCAVTKSGRVFSKKIVVATHFPFLNSHGSYFLKLYQQRSYVLALENTDFEGGMYIGDEENSLSFRGYKNLLLLGGGGHRTGKKGESYHALEKAKNEFYPKSREVTRFSTQDCMTLDGVPYIGHYSKNTPNLFVATGFNKWGMTSSMVAARLLSDLILEKENPYKEIFSPSRSILRPQLFINGAESVTNLLTPTVPRCPHLGCALKYNKQEHSWDCPCHGSRFNENGKLIDNPSLKNIKPPR